ncbi:hypothetical protein A8W25_19880 [Streptomyces sp. ERV7]|uniref:hypothetical protein n=1 Tax=Streptomyces sp. ERV7 TaxID=1322334 RepID=UPI0007F3F9E9|nr:hypothetical protein [Streptomyces sp. ERV7]OAR24634.1 hypothetical protein A8W25_19880 [Streptomyces sp. ERV7]
MITRTWWRRAAATATVLCLSATLAPGAQAATGDFTYVNVNDDDFTLHNPESGECLLLVSGAKSATNGTGGRAVLFADQGCEEPLGVMARGTSSRFIARVPHSVRFD